MQLLDTAIGLTPDLRPRQLPDETMKCGTQPANIRMINRRYVDPVSTSELKTNRQLKLPLDKFTK
jgi:hypothetical protein